MNQEKIGKFICESRKNKNLTQKELADKLGVTDKTVSRWENGYYLPDISLFNDICLILDIEVTELLKGEKNKNMDKENLKQTITNLVEISNKKINKNKRKIIIISGIIILLFLAIFITLLLKKEKSYRIISNSEVHFPTRYAIEQKEDGWFCHFDIEYLKTDMTKPYYYGYDCDNLKYSSLPNYYISGEEMDKDGIYEYKIDINHPSYIFNKQYSSDIKKINNYFLSKEFNQEISINDLEELSLDYIKKEDILNLFNKAIKSNMIYKYGNYPNTNRNPYVLTSKTIDNYTWKLGYYLVKGSIKYVNIELLIGEDYLSDLVKNKKATEEQKEIYENIQIIKNYIIENQKFSIPENLYKDRPYSFLDSIIGETKNYENE